MTSASFPCRIFLLPALAAFMAFLPSVARGQYFDYTPQLPGVEVDLSVLDDPSLLAVPDLSRQKRPESSVTAMPLPPLSGPAAVTPEVMPERSFNDGPRLPSPYRHRRVVDRAEIVPDSPALLPPPSPFVTPAAFVPVVKPPADKDLPPLRRQDPPRTKEPHPLPARKPKSLSPIETGQPLLVTGLSGAPLPAENVTAIIRREKAPYPEDTEQTENPAPLPSSYIPTVNVSPVRAVAPQPAPPSRPLAPVVESFVFKDGAAVTLSPDMRHRLHSLARDMTGNNQTTLRVEAFASSPDGTPSSARRTALSRGLAVRAHLMDLGILPTRIDVRALENDNSEKLLPPDRIDLVLE